VIYLPTGGASGGGRTTFTLKADQVVLLAHSCVWSMAIYLVLTVWELIRLNNETGPPAKMHEEMFRVLAVFFEGLEMIVTGAESKVAQVRATPLAPASAVRGGGSAMSKDSWKLFDLADPVTWRNLKFAVRVASRGAF